MVDHGAEGGNRPNAEEDRGVRQETGDRPIWSDGKLRLHRSVDGRLEPQVGRLPSYDSDSELVT